MVSCPSRSKRLVEANGSAALTKTWEKKHYVDGRALMSLTVVHPLHRPTISFRFKIQAAL
jgi:hypothetical protein